MTQTKHRHVRGIIGVTRRGVGYVTSEGTRAVDDIEVAGERLGTALNRDEVEVQVFPKRERGRIQGEVVKVIGRARTHFVGVLRRDVTGWYVSPDDQRIHVDFAVTAGKNSTLKEGHKALIEMKPWNDPNKNPEVVVVRLLGKAGEAKTERDAVVFAHGFSTDFPTEVRAEAAATRKSARITDLDIKERKDFRAVPTMTIDPSDAKDFDDALSVRADDGGTLEVGIHIADISHYMRPRSALDREAAERGTSVYLVGETIPMLPEALSNDLCSLNPGEDKLAFSAIFTFRKNGSVQSSWFGRTIIRSDKRFTYRQAQRSIDTGDGPFSRELRMLNALATALRRERFKNGAIDFDTDEVSITLDENGRPTAIVKKPRLDTNKLIEEFMLLANRHVAEFIHARTAAQNRVAARAFIYRVHDVPDRDKLEELSIFLKAIGYDLTRRGAAITPRDINALFKQIKGKPEEHLIKIATVRTMAKAVYTTKNIGHFGLAFRYYTHFTSPIRRYPDIMVHRLLARHLNKTPITERELAQYEKLALRSSEREMAAVEAERESVKYAQVSFMATRIGEEFDALVSGVTSWGLYVEEVSTMAEGLIRIASLTGDYYTLEQKRYRLIGEKTKKKFSLGDRVRVRLIAANPERRMLDFELAN